MGFTSHYDFEKLALKYGTPLYLYDIEQIQNQYRIIKESFSGFKSLICYALKANSNLSIIKTLANMGSGADCVSINEVKRAILADIPKYKIIFSGVGKEDYEIEEALKLGILFINVESEMELLRVERVVKKLSQMDEGLESTNNFLHHKISRPTCLKKARISIRVNPDVDAKTHPYISTGLQNSKFGVDISTAKQLYLYAHKSEFLEPVGIHYHIGSQILDPSPLLEASEKILDLTKSLLSANINLKFFDIGGGFGINYGKDERSFEISYYINEIIRKIDNLDLTAICEPGRFIVGGAGAILTRVIGEKRSKTKRFVIIDTAMNDLLRPSLYQAYHNVEKVTSGVTHLDLASCAASTDSEKCDIVGAVCESGDYIAKDRVLPSCQSGDLLLIESCGAYGYSMASNYNSRLKPAQIGIYKGESYVLQEREDFESSVKNELENLRDF